MATETPHGKREVVAEFDEYQFDGHTPAEIIELLTPFLTHPVYQNITFQVHRTEGYYHEVTLSFRLEGWRPESEREKTVRIENNRRQKEHRKKRKKLAADTEFAEFQRLQKKFAPRND